MWREIHAARARRNNAVVSWWPWLRWLCTPDDQANCLASSLAGLCVSIAVLGGLVAAGVQLFVAAVIFFPLHPLATFTTIMFLVAGVT
jgi:hypothetical protein